MAIHTIYTCDRCKRTMDAPNEDVFFTIDGNDECPVFSGKGMILTRHADSEFREDIHLCDSCRGEFWRFMERDNHD